MNVEWDKETMLYLMEFHQSASKLHWSLVFKISFGDNPVIIADQLIFSFQIK